MFSAFRGTKIRKTPIVFLVVVFILLILQLFDAPKHQLKDILSQSLDSANSKFVICRNVVNGKPFGEVNQFFKKERRIFFFSGFQNPIVKDSKHIWYKGIDTIQTVNCLKGETVCISSLVPEKLEVGDWSVDFVEGRHLIASRQFKVIDYENR